MFLWYNLYVIYMSNIKKGDIVEAEITGITKYGIFVKLEDNYTGLIHISEISNGFVNDINEVYSIGNIIRVKVLDIDEDKLQVKLSIKRVRAVYKKRSKGIQEKGEGFLPLKNKLNEWISDKIDKK